MPAVGPTLFRGVFLLVLIRISRIEVLQASILYFVSDIFFFVAWFQS